MGQGIVRATGTPKIVERVQAQDRKDVVSDGAVTEYGMKSKVAFIHQEGAEGQSAQRRY